MADNVAITAGSGTTISTDDVGSGVQVQRVKVQFGVDGSATDCSASSPLPSAVPEGTASGSLTATGSVTLTLANYSQAAVQVTGTWVGTLQFEASVDGTNFFSVPAIVPSTNAIVTSATAVGQWLVPVAGYKQVRVRCSAFTSGTIVISIQASAGTQIAQITGTQGNGTAATAIRVTVASDSTGTTACTSATAANFNVRGDHTLVDNAAFTDGTTRVGLAGFIFDETAGTALTENDAAAARIDSKRALVHVLEDATTRGQRQAVSSAGAAKVEGGAAHDAAVAGAPMLVGLEARTAVGTAVQSGDAVRALADVFGKQVFLLGALHEEQSNGVANFTNTTAADVIAAAGSGVKIAVTSILVTNAHATVGTKVSIRDGTTAKITGYAAAAGGGFAHNSGGRPLFIGTANTAITAICGTTGADVDVSISGYLIKN